MKKKWRRNEINYFSSNLIFKIVIAPPPTSLPDLEIYLTTLSGREVKYFKNGTNVDFFAPNFSTDFFENQEQANPHLLQF